MAALGDLVYRGTSLWKRLVGNTTTTRKFLRQVGNGTDSAAPAWDQVTDADLSTSDITTNNVSTSKHGFAPKLPNDATKYLDGTGAYTVPSGGGGSGALVLLEQHTASASASLDFTTAITSTYDDYVIEIVGLVPSTNNTDLHFLVSTNGGSSYASSGYAWTRAAVFFGDPNYVAAGSTSDSQFVIFPGLDNTTADACTDMSMRLKHPGNATLSTSYYAEGNTFYYNGGTVRMYNFTVGGKWRTQTAVNAFRFKMSSGNIASGTIRVYGIAK